MHNDIAVRGFPVVCRRRSRGPLFPIEYDITMNFPGGVPMTVSPQKTPAMAGV